MQHFRVIERSVALFACEQADCIQSKYAGEIVFILRCALDRICLHFDPVRVRNVFFFLNKTLFKLPIFGMTSWTLTRIDTAKLGELDPSYKYEQL